MASLHRMKPKGSVKYYPENDVLYMLIQAGEEAKSVEIEPGVTAELNKSGKLIGIEILTDSATTGTTTETENGFVSWTA
ncbi:MAG: DUF2283 domain-containing protein [Candidatus Binatia bacterium]